MRQMSKWMCGAALALVLAGCGTAQVARPLPEAQATPAPAVESHWGFNDARTEAERDGYRPPAKLAVLLPMSGELATAAGPVRDGLLAAYYAERRAKPELVFYDTAGTPSGAISARDRAIAEGADQILGPLGRDEVSVLFGSPPAVPMLALNRGNTAPPDNAADFSLAPEDEGAAAAAYLLGRNARQVLVLSNGDDHARRSVDAFRKALEAGGGAIAATLAVTGEDPGDQTPALRAAASREGGIDAVLFALRGSEARLLTPQLFASGLGHKPMVANSQLSSGTGKSEEDIALDGIVFASENWTLRGVPNLPSPATLAGDLPTARGPAARLFAFGYDAWLLSSYLQHLAADPAARVEGATGRLSLDASGNVVRVPAWATFRGGMVVPVPSTGG